MHYDFGLRSVKAVVLLARDYLKKERRYISFAMFILSSLEDSVHVIVRVYIHIGMTLQRLLRRRHCFKLYKILNCLSYSALMHKL